jgi:hypothetical protein
MIKNLNNLYTSLINKSKFWSFPTRSNITLNKKDISIIKLFSLPGFEKGIAPVVEKVFRCKIDGKIEITPKDVLDSDKAELAVYSLDKRIKFNLINETKFIETLDFVYNSMGLNQIKIHNLSVDDAISQLPSEGNSGFPLYSKKGREDSIERVKSDFNYFSSLNNFSSKIKFLVSNPCVIFHRFTPKIVKDSFPKKCKYKIRQIWGVPYLIILLEKMYFTKFILRFSDTMKIFYTSGMTRIEISNQISIVRKRAMAKNKMIMCGDIKGCDKSIPLCFFQLLAGFFKLSVGMRPDECMIIDMLFKYLCFTPYIDNVGRIKHTVGSTVSGSLLTSLFNTFVLFTSLSYIYLIEFNEFPKFGDLLVQGDDFLLLIDDVNQSERIKRRLKIFNLRLNLSATSVVSHEEEIDYLGFLWNIENEPNQTDDWIIARTTFPERYVELAGPDRSITRYLSLIFQIRRYYNLFKLFYHFDKYMKNKFDPGGDNTLYIIDSRGKVHKNKIPINTYLEYGWRLF